MYSLSGFGDMIADRIRTETYAQALREALTPDSVVLDIGAGTGIWSLLACRFGARKVYAIEPSDVIEVARETARANGFADRIQFIQDLSTRVTLPEKADIVISDIHGILPLYQSSVASILDARHRLLAPGGVLIPLRDTLWAAPVEKQELHETYVSPWQNNGFDFDMTSALNRVVNTWGKATGVRPADLVDDPQCWATLDYQVLNELNVRGSLDFTARRSGAVHGLVVWFDCFLREGLSFSNAPGMPDVIYNRAFFPWPEAVNVSPGDAITVELRADFMGDDYIWSWKSRVSGAGRPIAAFNQSQFYGNHFNMEQVRKHSPGFRPAVSEKGEAFLFVLRQMNGRTSVDEIARNLMDGFPMRFKETHEALTFVGEISRGYSR